MPDAGYLTIGKVVKKLQPQYPDLTISKVRYLEDEGLLNPSRTPSGYRLYSQHDVRRLETILYLQKNRFMPLSVIRRQLDGEGGEDADGLAAQAAHGGEFAAEELGRLHPIDHMPDVAGVSVSFVRQLSEVGLVQLKRSPHGRDLVDGRDLPLIRTCDELAHFGIGPKNLRQYVIAANRESPMFEHALVAYSRRGGGVEMEQSAETRRQYDEALDRMLALTGDVREALLRRRIAADKGPDKE